MSSSIPWFTAWPACIIAPGNFYTDVWEPATNWYHGAGDVYDSQPAAGFTWWHFTAIQLGQIYIPDPTPITPEEAEELCKQALGNPDSNSILKVEIQYPLGNGFMRTFRIDIGSGIDLIIPPTWDVQARILAPVPQEGALVPAGFDPDLWVVARLILRAVCITSPFGNPSEMTYTTPVFISDPDQNEAIVMLEEGAVAVEACFDSPPTQPLEFILIRRDADGNVIDITVIASIAPIPGENCFPKTAIPRPANAVRYADIIAPLGLAGTITQYLDFS